ncbi:MAG: Nif3-like dinuclear metal center hexameric protein, partial [Clostridia bacterium]|nr:Nif3-like dinuclear metal center hexameric protein [Clostridia bacterium]
MIVKDVFQILDQIAPFDTQMGFDNAGLLIGSMEKAIHRIGVVLDVTNDTLEQAIEQGVDCIVSHHPIIFSALQSIEESSVVYRAIANGITVISAHTNLDAARGGVNDVLCARLGLNGVEALAIPGETTPALGRIGFLPESMSAESFAQFLNQQLNTRVKYVSVNTPIHKVAVCGGSGADFMLLARSAGANALVTSEVKHHQFLEAQSLAFMMVDAGHFETENPVVEPLFNYLKQKCSNEVEV